MQKEMKDSRIDWVKQIPAHWKIHPVYSYFNERKNKNSLGKENNLLSLSYGRIIRKNINTTEGLLPKSFNTYHIVEAGDIIIRPTDLQNDKRSLRTGLVKEHGIITSAYIDLAPKKVLDSRYFHYLLHSYDISKVFYNMGNGVRQSLSFPEFSHLMMIEPPFEEQKQIADFLDHKCDEIDALHADIEKQIATLEEYKKSIITEAVTKGLNPGVEMKDSGIEWCPSIPKHWIKTNPKFLFSLRNQKALPGEQQLTASQKYGIIAQDEFMKIENQQLVTVTKDFSILKHVEPNDFVISMRSFQGGLEYSKLRGCISSAYVMLIPNSKKVYPPFYKWFFKSTKYINALQSTTNLVRDGQAMRYANFIQIPLFIIPISEQQEIADYLDQKTTEIDSIISAKKQQLDVLENYKKSLIYEYVTGKKEVPSYANAE